MQMVEVKYAYYTRNIRVLYVFWKYVQWRIFKCMRFCHALSRCTVNQFSQDSKSDIRQPSSVVSPSLIRVHEELIEFKHSKNSKIRRFTENTRILQCLQCLSSMISSWILTKLGVRTDGDYPMSDFESWSNWSRIKQDNPWPKLVSTYIRVLLFAYFAPFPSFCS